MVQNFKTVRLAAVQYSPAFLDLKGSVAKASAVCTENLIRVDAVMESPKLAE